MARIRRAAIRLRVEPMVAASASDNFLSKPMNGPTTGPWRRRYYDGGVICGLSGAVTDHELVSISVDPPVLPSEVEAHALATV